MVHYLPCSMKLCQSQTSIEFLGSQCGQIYAIFILNFKRTVHEPQVAPKYHLLFCIQYSFYNSPVAFLSLYINTSSYSKKYMFDVYLLPIQCLHPFRLFTRYIYGLAFGVNKSLPPSRTIIILGRS